MICGAEVNWFCSCEIFDWKSLKKCTQKISKLCLLFANIYGKRGGSLFYTWNNAYLLNVFFFKLFGDLHKKKKKKQRRKEMSKFAGVITEHHLIIYIRFKCSVLLYVLTTTFLNIFVTNFQAPSTDAWEVIT